MKYIFVGNRRFVLEEMLEQSLNVTKVFVMKGTHLERDITKIDLPYKVISSKKELLEDINSADYDVLISNGCHYILPISKMPPKKYVNIHPSYLPDLKGADPAIGAILFQKDSGATCHVMNDRVDEGDIISQIKIPYTEDLDICLLYQLSFIAEKKVFAEAYEKGFVPVKSQEKRDDNIYFSRKPSDKIIDVTEPVSRIRQRIKSFSNKSQGCELKLKGGTYRIHQMEILTNSFLEKYARGFRTYEVILNYEDSLIFKNKANQIILFRSLTDSLSTIDIRTNLNC